ncbi:hypothetical protein Bhyg_09952 [Pseudolycoriella hygida]|uniref:Uncharacterized protein n=1 Tax=Pseudolycoriella hygida TaxID=35572 RepID=A0A9Q0MSJ0_9DIPT|nr:hypothetical protein Bhyg_09952 [Pseudolycoriella hygida]
MELWVFGKGTEFSTQAIHQALFMERAFQNKISKQSVIIQRQVKMHLVRDRLSLGTLYQTRKKLRNKNEMFLTKLHRMICFMFRVIVIQMLRESIFPIRCNRDFYPQFYSKMSFGNTIFPNMLADKRKTFLASVKFGTTTETIRMSFLIAVGNHTLIKPGP